jgi:hypothetical protein
VRRVGRREPRLFTPPLRPLNRRTSRGYECIDFVEQVLGETLQPWQKWWLIHVLELNPDGTYRFRTVLTLVARQNGKSNVKRWLSLWRLYCDGARVILGTAQDVALAREQMGLCKASIWESPGLLAEWGGERKVNANEFFWLDDSSLPKGSPVEAYPRYLIRASNKKAGRGLSIDELNIDELREQTDWAAWGAVSKTVLARPYAQIHAVSNQGDSTSVVLNQLRERALANADPSLGIFEWSAPDGCALDDPAAIAQANPGLGHVISWVAIMSALATDPPNLFRTEVLCQSVDQLDGAFNTAAWKECGDSTLMPPTGRSVAAVFEVSEGLGHATLAICEVGPTGTAQVAIRAAWSDMTKAREELLWVLGELRPGSFAWYPSGPAAAFATLLRPTSKDGKLRPTDKHGNPVAGRIPVTELSGGKQVEACMELDALIKGRQIVHNEDPLANAHISGAVKAPAADGWRIQRRGGGNVDAAYAIAGAVKQAKTHPRREVKLRGVS